MLRRSSRYSTVLASRHTGQMRNISTWDVQQVVTSWCRVEQGAGGRRQTETVFNSVLIPQTSSSCSPLVLVFTLVFGNEGSESDSSRHRQVARPSVSAATPTLHPHLPFFLYRMKPWRFLLRSTTQHVVPVLVILLTVCWFMKQPFWLNRSINKPKSFVLENWPCMLHLPLSAGFSLAPRQRGFSTWQY